jgi:hypothetical protein
VKADDEVVPWLAATGDLAYSPESPPERDYFFQYSWVVPGILREGVNRKRHYWFGEPWKDNPTVQRLFRFWNDARRSAHDPLFVSNGLTDSARDVTAPIAAYRHEGRLLLMQHGSCHIGDMDSQPRIEQGEAILIRGIQRAPAFLVYRLSTAAMRRRIMDVHARSLTDSVVSFNAAHCNLMRTETGYLNDETFVFDRHCREVGLDSTAPAIRSMIYSGYALEDWCASAKFGPNYVKFRTPLTNIRITTFVAGETEVKVIDPNKLDVIEAVGCTVREVHV